MAITKQSAGHVQAELSIGDVEIGAVELKNATDDTRAKIAATASISEGDNAVAMQAPVLGATADAVIVTDAVGTLSGKLRGLVKWAFERMPASLGQTTMSASLPVTLASDGAGGAIGTTADAAIITDTTGSLSGKLRGLIALWLGGLKAGEAHIGEVGGKAIAITVTPTLTVGATYVANDFVGTNNTAMTFAGAARIAAGSGTVIGATLIDYVVASAAAELWLFSAAPAGLGLDSAAFTITDADSLLCIGVIPFSTYYASALNSVSSGSIPNSNLPFKLASGTSLFGALVTRGAPAYTNGLVSVRVVIAQD